MWREQAGIDIIGDIQRRRQFQQRLAPVRQKAVGRNGNEERQPRFLCASNVGKHRLKMARAADLFVFLLTGAVKRDLNQSRRIPLKESDAIFVQKNPVGEHRRPYAKLLQVEIDCIEIRVRQTFAACQCGFHHACCGRLINHPDPTICHQQTALTQLLWRQTHIAHLAFQVAQGRQLEHSLIGDGFFTRLKSEVFVIHLLGCGCIHPLFLRLTKCFQQVAGKIDTCRFVMHERSPHPWCRWFAASQSPASARHCHQPRRRGRPAIHTRPSNRAAG